MTSTKHLVIVSLIFSGFLCQGQDNELEKDTDHLIKKGTTFLGSYFNFSNTTTSVNRVKGVDTQSSTIKLGGNATAGRMLSDHWGLLLNIGYVSSQTTTPAVVNATLYSLKETKSDFTIAPSVRYYQFVSEGIYFFLQGTVFISAGTQDTNEFDKNDNLVTYSFKTNGFGMGISPGVSYFLSKKLSTEISIGVLGFGTLSGKDVLGNTTQTNTFQSLFYQNSVSLGFVFYF